MSEFFRSFPTAAELERFSIDDLRAQCIFRNLQFLPRSTKQQLRSLVSAHLDESISGTILEDGTSIGELTLFRQRQALRALNVRNVVDADVPRMLAATIAERLRAADSDDEDDVDARLGVPPLGALSARRPANARSPAPRGRAPRRSVNVRGGEVNIRGVDVEAPSQQPLATRHVGSQGAARGHAPLRTRGGVSAREPVFDGDEEEQDYEEDEEGEDEELHPRDAPLLISRRFDRPGSARRPAPLRPRSASSFLDDAANGDLDPPSRDGRSPRGRAAGGSMLSRSPARNVRDLSERSPASSRLAASRARAVSWSDMRRSTPKRSRDEDVYDDNFDEFSEGEDYDSADAHSPARRRRHASGRSSGERAPNQIVLGSASTQSISSAPATASAAGASGVLTHPVFPGMGSQVSLAGFGASALGGWGQLDGLSSGFGPHLAGFGGSAAVGGGALDPRSLPIEQGTPFTERLQRRISLIEQSRFALSRTAEDKRPSNRYRETSFNIVSAIHEACLFSTFSHSFHLAGSELASIAAAPTADPTAIQAISQCLLSASAAAFTAAQNRVTLQRFLSRRDTLVNHMLVDADRSFRESFHILTPPQEAAAAVDTALEAGRNTQRAPRSWGAWPRDSSVSFRTRRDDDRRRDRERDLDLERSGRDDRARRGGRGDGSDGDGANSDTRRRGHSN